MWVYLFAIGAAVLFGLGSVIQQRVAFDAPPGKNLKLGLLFWLFRQPMWLIGVLTAALGNGLSASALAVGSVAAVQPLLVVRLLFAVPLSAVWGRQRLALRDWVGMLAVAGGLGVFLAVGRPKPEKGPGTSLLPWALAAGLVVIFLLLLVTVARRLRPQVQAPLLGAGAGVLFGVQSGLMHVAVNRFTDHGLVALLTSPMTYGVALCSIIGTLLSQSAFEMAPFAASYPTLAAVEPLAGIGIGLGVLGGSLAFGPLPIAIEAAGLMVMTVGIYLLATSPLVSSSKEEMWWRQIEERTAALERDLAHRVRTMRHDLDNVDRLRDDDPQRRRLLQQVGAHLVEAGECAQSLSRLNEQALAEAEQRKREPATAPEAEHDRLMARYSAQLCEREEGLRADLDELGGRHQRLSG